MTNKMYIFSTILTLLLVSIFGFFSSKRIRTSSDFAVGGRSLGSSQVAGSIIATIVGGASTIGTAELAFNRGINAMWFTLGASIACLFLGIFLAGPLRRAEVETISEFLVRYYGEKAGLATSVLTSIAIFIHITGQVLSSVAILTSMFSVEERVAVIITIGLIISYIIFGGFWGTSIVGILKTLLLYMTLIISGAIVLDKLDGISGLKSSLPPKPWFDMFSGGLWEGLAQGFSLVVGICATQTYLQAMFAGKNEKTSRRGAFISALLIPPIGLVCALIGMFMRINYPTLLSNQALPAFIITYLNPWIGGIMIAALIISVVGTGAGLTLGISTMISRDIYKRLLNPKADDKKQLRVLRVSVFCISFLAMLMVVFNIDSLILKWGFLSMALRGTVVFIPLILAIYLKGKVNKRAGLATMVLSPLITVLYSILKITYIEPLYIGLFASLTIYVIVHIIEHSYVRYKKV
ncbi:sodium:solute symporter family protein [Wukongibacter sp. M2B1]|uniref:sodium:solute symporter family protein n=1 Tax=Wukongibacter sp. M2B1 TaxID=3088895 RepID=UPI003D78DADC